MPGGIKRGEGKGARGSPGTDLIRSSLVRYAETIDLAQTVWQAGYDDFSLFTERKPEERLVDMHMNPVRAGLVERPTDGPWTSSRFDETGQSVGVPVVWLH